MSDIEEVNAQAYIKGLRDGKDIGYQQGRADVIDEFKEYFEFNLSETFMWNEIIEASKDNEFQKHSDAILDYVFETFMNMAEQLKEKKNE